MEQEIAVLLYSSISKLVSAGGLIEVKFSLYELSV